MPRKQSSKTKKIALERIEKLFQQAEKVWPDKKLANRYVQLARKIAMKARLPIPTKYKREFCKHCHSYLRPGQNARIRTRSGKVIIYCKECKKYTRIPLK